MQQFTLNVFDGNPSDYIENEWINIGPNCISFTSVATSWEERLDAYYYASRRGLSFLHCTYVPILNFDYLGKCSIDYMCIWDIFII